MSVVSDNKVAETKSQTFTFALILGGVTEVTEEMASAVYDRCEDALCGEYCGRPYVTFDREATSLGSAIVSAIGDVESSISGVRVVEVRPPGIEFIELANDILKMRAEDSRRTMAEDLWKVLANNISSTSQPER